MINMDIWDYRINDPSVERLLEYCRAYGSFAIISLMVRILTLII